jgi:hypothetical protein
MSAYLYPNLKSKKAYKAGPEYDVPAEIENHPKLIDASWHNDVWPSFDVREFVETERQAYTVRIWVRHPDLAERMAGECPCPERFSTYAIDCANGEELGESKEFETAAEAIAHALMLANAIKIAIGLGRVLREWLTPDEMDTVRARNKAQDHPSVCHSHDFCDANEAMAEAFQSVVGAEIDLQDDSHLALWGDAWTMAKASGFTMEEVR